MFEEIDKAMNKISDEKKYGSKLEEDNKINMKNYLPEKISDKVRYYLNYPKIKIEYVSEYIIGRHVLGRAFPSKKLIQIWDKVYGNLRKKVKFHEKIHIRHPDWSEYKVRVMSDTLHI